MSSELAEGAIGQGLPAGARVVVAMSGGVDSSVAAALFLRAGFAVVGVTLQLQDCVPGTASTGEARSCCGVDALTRARAVAGALGVHHYVLNYATLFNDAVLRPAWEAYAQGCTPSPCLTCNETVKFGALLSWAADIGAAALVTGHYARIRRDAAGSIALYRGVDGGKDQSYFLAGLTQAQLQRVHLPLGDFTKAQVRALARAYDLPVAQVADSQDACLVGAGHSFAEMLRLRFEGVSRPGEVLNEAGEVVATHAGVHHFTVGQRQGLALRTTQRHWVQTIDPATAAVRVTAQISRLDALQLVAERVQWVSGQIPRAPIACQAQIRYRSPPADAVVEPCGEQAARVRFSQPVRAVTPGQAVVFYLDACVLGKGTISRGD